MKKMTSLLITTLAGALALTGGACSSSGGGKTGTGGTAATGTGGGTGGTDANLIPLPSTSTGFVQDPVSMVVGAWFAYGDGVGANANTTTTDNANSDCVLKGGFSPSDCSQISTPTPGMAFAPSDAASSKMCTMGIAALVMNKGATADYSDLWGAGIGLDFNNPGGDAGPAGYFDVTPYKGISFDFSADVLPVASMRVNFPFKTEHGTDSPYWMGATMKNSPLTGTTAMPQHVEIDWADVGGPYYLSQQTPVVPAPAFDATAQAAVQAIQFQVFTNAMTTTPYSFCVANLALVKKD
ncbi:MAG TPA: hypothetical protein VHZ54_06380 [Solirubrobacterales bacterium]|jgi:hypothetical protein|nr:hypothetical protein [Solirubrobacterales bacterium]